MADFFKARGIGRLVPIHFLIDWLASEGGTKFDPDRDVIAEERKSIGTISGPPGRSAPSPRGQELAKMYRAAEAEFARKAFDGDIIVRGFPGADRIRARVEVPKDIFEDIKVVSWGVFGDQNLQFDRLLDTKNHYLEHHVEDDGSNGISCRIVRKDVVLFSGLCVETIDVFRAWNFASSTSSDGDWFAKQWEREDLPLSAAILWIVTNGRIAYNDGDFDTTALKRAQAELISEIREDGLSVTGEQQNGKPEKVPPVMFRVACQPIGEDLPLDPIFSDTPTLRWGALGEDDWRRGRGDRIESRVSIAWMRLTVMKRDVLRRWPARDLPSRNSSAAQQLESVLREMVLVRESPSQKESEAIAEKLELKLTREKNREIHRKVIYGGGRGKTGPKGPRKNRAAPSA